MERLVLLLLMVVLTLATAEPPSIKIDTRIKFGDEAQVQDRVPGNFPNRKTPSNCRTLNGNNCVFPFRYNGVLYDKCTYADSRTPWCALLTNSNTFEVVTNRWEDCDLRNCAVENNGNNGNNGNYGNWNHWSSWNSCSVTCGSNRRGTQIRTRTCGGNQGGCRGDSRETRSCTAQRCQQGNWNSWTSWTFCSNPCQGTQTRTRTCSRSGYCQGENNERRNCYSSNCNSNYCDRPGATKRVDCNTCQCSRQGQWICTEQYCPPPTSCYTNSGPSSNQQCQFPFRWGGRTYNSCATWRWSGVNYGRRWCSTRTDSRGNHINGRGFYGFCESSQACRNSRPSSNPGGQFDVGNRDAFGGAEDSNDKDAVSFGDGGEGNTDVGEAPE